MNLHIPTVFVMIVVTAAVMAMALAAVANRQHLDLRPWSIGLLLQVLTYVLYALRGQVPDVVSIVVANMAIAGAMAMYSVGLLRFYQRPAPAWLVAGPVLAAGLVFFVWIDNFEARLLLSSMFNLAQNLFNIGIILRFRHTAPGRGQHMLMVGALLLCTFMLVRLAAWATGWGPQSLSSTSLSQAGTFMATLISTVLLAVGVLTMGQERAEAALASSEMRYRKLIESANEGIGVLEGGCVRFANRKLCEQLGLGLEQVVGRSFLDFIHPDDRAQALAVHSQRLLGQADLQTYTFRMLTHTEEDRWFSIGGVPYEWQGLPATLNFVTDVTERRAQEAQIRELAFHDTLTLLPNRRLLLEHLTQAMTRNQRSGQHSAVVFMDLDNFKPLNDQHGHNAGDLLLTEVAERLRKNCRAMDTAARFGGMSLLCC